MIDPSYDQFRLKTGSVESWYCGDVKIAASPNNSRFATGAGDGSLKIWRVLDFMQKKLVHRPVLSDKLGSAIIKLEFTSEDSILVATIDGRLLNYRIRDSGALVIDNIKSVNPNSQGKLVDFVTLKHKKPCEVIYGTSHRTISHWDTRTRNDISWSFKTKIDDGLLSCLALPGNGFSQYHWLSYATQKGMHVIWDVRYQLACNFFQHPRNRGSVKIDLVNSGGPSLGTTRPGTRLETLNEENSHFGPVDLEYAPISSWNKYLASVSEGVNEINWWNIETGEQISSILANPQDYTDNENLPSITSTNFFGKNERSLITAGTDRIVRFWDLDEPTTGSFTICDAPTYDAGASNINSNFNPFQPNKIRTWHASIIERIRLVQEIREPMREKFQGNCEGTGDFGKFRDNDRILFPNGNLDDKALQSPLPHVDAITDVCVLHCSSGNTGDGGNSGDFDLAPNAFVTGVNLVENFLITATRNGYVNIWK